MSTEQPNLQELTERLTKLENLVNRRAWLSLLHSVMWVLVVLCLLPLLGLEPWSGTVRARKLFLTAEDGKAQVILAAYPHGSALHLLDPNGIPRVMFQTDARLPVMMLMDPSGNPITIKP